MSEIETSPDPKKVESNNLTNTHIVNIGGLAVFGAASYMLDVDKDRSSDLAIDTDDQLGPTA